MWVMMYMHETSSYLEVDHVVHDYELNEHLGKS